MKINHIEYLFKDRRFSGTKEFQQIQSDIIGAIRNVKHPKGSRNFKIYPERQGNGVKPIKLACMNYLLKNGWLLEHRMNLGATIELGRVDAVKQNKDGRFFALEWETGNISSSHRAINKIVIGIHRGILSGGVLIVPSRRFYSFLTDRIGNYDELKPYFYMWRKLKFPNSILAVVEIEHDAESIAVPKIPKGTDGRAKI